MTNETGPTQLQELSRKAGDFQIRVLRPVTSGERDLPGCTETPAFEVPEDEVVLLVADGPIEFPVAGADASDRWFLLSAEVAEQLQPKNGGFDALPASHAEEVQRMVEGVRVYRRTDGPVPMRAVAAAAPDGRPYAPAYEVCAAIVDELAPEVTLLRTKQGVPVHVAFPTGELPVVDWGELQSFDRPIGRGKVRRWKRRPFTTGGTVDIAGADVRSTADYLAEGELVYTDNDVLVPPLAIPSDGSSWVALHATPRRGKGRPLPPWNPTSFLLDHGDQIAIVRDLVLPDAARRVGATATLVVPTRQGLV